MERDRPTSVQYPGARAPWAFRPTFESWLVLSPWFFLKKRQRALRIGQTDPRTIWTDRKESGVGHQLTHAGPPRTGSQGPTRTSPLNSSPSTMFRPSQRRANPRPDPCYARGLEESWADRILGTGIKKSLSDLPNPMVTCPKKTDRDKREPQPY